MKLQRKLKLTEDKIKRMMQENEATFETISYKIFEDIKKMDIQELEEAIYKQKENIEKYSKSMKSLRLQLKITNELKNNVKEMENE